MKSKLKRQRKSGKKEKKNVENDSEGEESEPGRWTG